MSWFIGVYLLLKEKFYANRTTFFPSEIRCRGCTLRCITDLKPCCKTPYYIDLEMMIYGLPGNWFFPNGTEVYSYTYYWSLWSWNFPSHFFFRNRGTSGNINLNLWSDENSTNTFPIGLYCCVVLDAKRTNKTICAAIGK